MLFAAVEAGHYIIIDEGKVVADIKRVKTFFPSPSPAQHLWSKTHYNVCWFANQEVERFDTLPDIQEKYRFCNYAGYGKVLKRR